MANAYPELPAIAYARTSVSMPDVIACMHAAPGLTEVKRAAYIIFRIESANGSAGLNNNYCGFQADAGRWPAQFDPLLAGVVTERENGTGRVRLFLAFHDVAGCLAMLLDRLQSRGLYIGGTTHLVTHEAVSTESDLARVYYQEWAAGSASYEPTLAQIAAFGSMYAQAAGFFPGGTVAPGFAAAVLSVTPSIPASAKPPLTADDLNSLAQQGATFPLQPKETAS